MGQGVARVDPQALVAVGQDRIGIAGDAGGHVVSDPDAAEPHPAAEDERDDLFNARRDAV
jgi:hypothetical protein